ncbi:hypothetical protein [Pyrodictium delaneyi]|nr:hypothetical protein [Pyrodictium delaneyi]
MEALHTYITCILGPYYTRGLQAMSRAEATKSTVGDTVPMEVLERVAGELRRFGVRVYVMPDPRGVPDLYIREEDNALLDRLCDEKKLSKAAEELLC